ncbi:MAG: copper resistance protein CopC [Corynebacterium sp.]|nr:copper resistance protein CopC [Corynebacterium sp.]
MKIQSRAILAVLFALMAMIFPVSSLKAFAHDAVVNSNPANGAVVDTLPRKYEIEFSGEPQNVFNTVALSNSDSGDILYTTTPELDGRLVRFELPDTVQGGNGHYTIGFQITSSDGHATRGKLEFSVDDGSTSSTETESAEAQPSGSSSHLGLIIAIIVVLIVLLAVIIFVRMRK